MTRALLIGKEPAGIFSCEYTDKEPYDAVVIGSMMLGELLKFREERVLEALSSGKPVYFYTPGMPSSGKNRALGAALASAQRELKNYGVIFTDGSRKRLVTAEDARMLRQTGQKPGPGAVLTPLAKEILEGSD